ncbi:MAG: HipA N-terminal domain-containing protein [Bacteroidales bacterium]|nr:HipA N-terminal domain-containing protein [Bacteroidales bacterium]
MRQLEILWNGVNAGTLTELAPGKGYRFEYAPSYLAGSSPNISVTLPKKMTTFESDSLFPFFANMLPEGALRRVVCRQHHVDENDLFGILCAMSGADSIGSIDVKEVAQ